MKYSKSNMPLCCMMSQSLCYKGTSTMIPKGILWHSTGANNSNLKRYVQPDDNAKDKDKWIELLGKNINKNDMNHSNREMGVNAWIGKLKDGTVTTIQTLPWNYRPWGCASGSKGSCNNGWIQFEICEDALTDKKYFEKIYEEACELTAYLCDMYNFNPEGYTNCNEVKVPVILCHADAHDLGLASNHGDIYHWFTKYGKTMDDVRKDVAKLMGKTTSKIEEPKEIYRVRKSWEDEKSQLGAYENLDNAKKICDKAINEGYEIYNSKGIAIYPNTPEEEDEDEEVLTFKIGDSVQLKNNAKYVTGVTVPVWLTEKELFVREIRENGDIVFSIQKTGKVTGAVNPKYLLAYTKKAISSIEPIDTFKPYIVSIDTAVLNVRSGAGTTFKINTQVGRHELYTIVEEKNGWGKLKSGAGWISLDYVKKVK